MTGHRPWSQIRRSTPEQMKNWLVCQSCGRVASVKEAGDDGWLVSPRRADPDILVVRCPKDISEWALRQSQAGRTKEWRQRAVEAQATEERRLNPLLEPFPSKDEPPED